MLVNFDEVVTGALVNAIAVVGRRISKAAVGLRKTDEGLATARWFETFRLTGTPPDLPDLSAATAERLTEVLGGDEIQAALQELLAVRLTDAPEADASRARDALQTALGNAAPDADAFTEALAGYYDDQVCALVARLEGEEPPVLAQIRSEAFSARQLTVLQAIERHTAALAEGKRQPGDGSAPGGPPAGRLLAGVTDPFDLEVHRAVQATGAVPGLPVLPTYVPREHDRDLAGLVRAAAMGRSGVAVLVGGSSTGKTRACWEALGLLREEEPGWRLCHPIDPSRPEAALRELPSIGPRTVVWLNEAQLYLDVAAGGLGERVAAGLRELLRDLARGPVLVLATLWPEFWGRLTARPPAGEDPNAQARELLAGRDIGVPAAFTPAQVQQLATASDPRLAQASGAAEGGQVTQFLAGAPELLARYRNAPPGAAGLITAAIDARRLGMGVALPLAFLEAAAPGYLTDADWDRLGEDWLERALAYTAALASGIRGPLSRIRPRTVGSATPVSEPVYRLADYLDQHGRRARRALFPPAGFWTAAARFAAPGDLPALAAAAEDRGLYRDAARLRKHATAHGDTNQAVALVRQWHSLHPHSSDPNPAQWAAAHAGLDDPVAVASLLDALCEAGTQEPVAVLIARDPAAHAPLDDPDGVTGLLVALHAADAEEQVAALAVRAAAHIGLGDPRALARLLAALCEAGAQEQAAVLAGRAATHIALDNPWDVADLLEAMHRAGAQEQAAALAGRAATHIGLGDPQTVARLLLAMRKAGVEEQAAALLARHPAAHTALDHQEAVAALIGIMRWVGAQEQAAALAGRAATHAGLDPHRVTELLFAMRREGAGEQAAALAVRAAGYAALDNPFAVPRLLDALREAGAQEQASTLAARAAAHTDLGNPRAVTRLLNALRKAGAQEQAAALIARDPAARADLADLYDITRLLNALREAGAQEQAAVLADRAAAHAGLGDPRAVAELLVAMHKARAGKQAAILAGRAAAHADLGNPDFAAGLLEAMQVAGTEEQAAVLADRAAAHAGLDNPWDVAELRKALYKAGARDQAAALADRAVAHADLGNPDHVARLLDALRSAGAEEQVAALIARDPAAHADLGNPNAVVELLAAMHRAAAGDQAAALAGRAVAYADFDEPNGVAQLLYALREAGADEQAKVLAGRAAAQAALDDPHDVSWLLSLLLKPGSDDQAMVLVERLPAEGLFDLFRRQAGHEVRFGFGREAGGSPAPPWGWDDLE